MHFPLFLDLTGKRAVIVGGGTIGMRRARVLHEFGACVTVIDPSPKENIEGITYVKRPYAAGDLLDAFLALAATSSAEVNDAVEQEARDRGILFNRSDNKAACDFFFPAICKGEHLVAGVVGDGSDHHRAARAAKAVRKVLEELP